MQSLTSRLQLIEHPAKTGIEYLVDDMGLWPDVIVMVHDFATQCTYVSKQQKEVLGHGRACWNNEFLSDITHPDDIFTINEKMSAYLIESSNPLYEKEGPHVLKILGRMRSATGQYKLLEFSGVILQYDNQGGFRLGLGVYQDVSLRKNGSEYLKREILQLTRRVEDHLLEIKRLYFEMFPCRHDNFIQIENAQVPKINIVRPEQLAIKVKYGVEIEKILSKPASGSQGLPDMGKISVEDLPVATRVIQFIEQHLSNPAFTIEEFARIMNISRGHLYRKILDIFGISPAELLKQMRLYKAAFLLQTSNESVTSVAFAVGFADSSYFAKCFRSHYGTTPFEFRKAIRQ